jgi:two-component system sensor histidine kinase QseC
MAPSIRTFLLLNLLLGTTLITSLAIIANLYLGHKDIQEQLDSQLIITALRIKSIISDENYKDNKSNLLNIQKKLNEIPQEIVNLHKIQRNTLFQPLFDKVEFQAVNSRHQIILNSKNNAGGTMMFNVKPGLHDIWVKDQQWRVFSTYEPKSQITVIVAEKHDLRRKLEAQITTSSMLIMLITYPLLGLLIWIIVGRGLNPLKKVTQEVGHRAPNYLEPLDLDLIPTEIKPLIDELNELFIRLKRAFEREKRFAADAAHELRTPLAALKAHVQVALKSPEGEEQNAALQKVLAGVNRSAHVVQQLLIMSRMAPETAAEGITEVNLTKEATEMIAELAPQALKQNTEIELIASQAIPNIKGHPTALGILIRNLIDNAIRYTPPDSLIKVIIEDFKNQVVLKVIDNGPGIPEELRQRVFERFYRILGSRSSGSGLGLSIVQQIATLHNASLELKTPASGNGLEVIVSFPKI